MKQRFFTFADVAKLLRVSHRTVHNWVRVHHFVEPVRYSATPGDVTLLAEESAFALTVALACQQQHGFPLARCGTVAKWIDFESVPSLRDQIRRGRKFLVLVGDQITSNRSLLTEKEAFEPSQRVRRLMKQTGKSACILNIGAVYRFYCDELARVDAERAGESGKALEPVASAAE